MDVLRRTNIALVIALLLPFGVVAQQAPAAAQDLAKPEEIVITGQRYQLHKLMLEAEKNAYEVFNKFNDDKRFNISCSVNKPTGSLLNKQSCTPEFEIQATQAHAQDYYRSLRDFINPAPGDPTDGNSMPSGPPMEAMIGRDLAAYRYKLKQMAEQHPEFLDAIVKYTEVKAKYEGVGSTAGGKN